MVPQFVVRTLGEGVDTVHVSPKEGMLAVSRCPFNIILTVIVIIVVVRVYTDVCTPALTHLWFSDDSCVELVLSFHHVRSWGRSQVLRLAASTSTS